MTVFAGFDYSLTHGALTYLRELDNKPINLLEYNRKKKKYMCISYKDRDFVKFDNSLDSIVNYLESVYQKKDIVLGIDSSALVHFNSRRIQTFVTGYAIGYLRTELEKAFAKHVVLVTPAEIRTFAGLKRNEKKQNVQDWYLTNTILSDILLPASHSEDSIDAAIIAYYLQETISFS